MIQGRLSPGRIEPIDRLALRRQAWLIDLIGPFG
jgi:hypothetical protein